MSTIRTALATGVSLGTVALVAALPTAGPALLADPTDLFSWWEHYGTPAATIGIVHLAALASALYVTVVLAGITAAMAIRVPRAALALARCAPGTIRRSLVVSVAATTMAASGAAGQETIVIVDVGPEISSSEPITLTDLGAVHSSGPTPSTVEWSSSALMQHPQSGPAGNSPAEDGLRTAPTAATPDAWLVEPGDNLWSIAESVITDHGNRLPETSIVASYWRVLVDSNQHVTRDPNLIFPGQILNLPPLVTDGN